MKTISLTVSNRPEYLKKFLDTLRKCHYINEYELIIGLEPICMESWRICKSIDFIPTKIIYNEKKLGVKENPYRLLNHIFQFSEFNIYLEEDIILSEDAISICEWYWNSKLYNEFVCLNLHNYWSLDPNANPKKVKIIPPEDFIAFGWAMDKLQWNNTFSKWWYLTGRGWDWVIRTCLSQNKKTIIAPEFSRCNHIGEFGTHAGPKDMIEFRKRPLYQGSPIWPEEFVYEK